MSFNLYILIFTISLICMNSNYIKGNYCEEGKYGENCERYCWCRADKSLNKTCNKQGQCYCISGFKGLHCHKEECQIDDDDRSCKEVCDCNGHPCINGICQCTGWSWGTRCEQTCHCSHNGAYGCKSNGYCRCQNRRTGKTCDKNCYCLWAYNAFSSCNDREVCDCKHGFFGSYCEQKISDISNTTESYDGERDVPICFKGFWGDTCEKRCDCDYDKIIGCDQKNGTCECATTYFGEKCEHDRIQLCKCDEKGSKSKVCNNDGTCRCKDGHWGQKCHRLGPAPHSTED